MMDNIYVTHLNERSDFIYSLAKLSGMSVDDFNDRIYRLLDKEFKGETVKSGDTQYVGTDSLSDLLLAALIALEDHSTRNDNPHEETTESIGTLTVDEIEALVSVEEDGVESGLIPIDIVGYDTRTWEPVPLNDFIIYSPADGGSILITGEVLYSIYATPYILEVGEFPILEQCPNWPNHDVHLYIGLEKGISKIMMFDSRVPDSVARIHIGILYNTSKSISQLIPIIRMSGMRVSELPVPYGIPVGPGPFRSASKLHPGWLGAVGDLTPDRPSGLSITFTYFTHAAGNRIGTRNGTTVYTLYQNYKETEDGENATFTAILSGLVSTATWSIRGVSGGVASVTTTGLNADKDAMDFLVGTLPLGSSELTVTITDVNDNSVTRKLFIDCVKPLSLTFGSTDMTLTTGMFEGSDITHYYMATVDKEYYINVNMDGSEYTENYRYSAARGRPGVTHSAQLVRIGKGRYTIKFTGEGSGDVIIFVEDNYGTRVTQTINVNVKLDPPPVYRPVFTAYEDGYMGTVVLNGLPNYYKYSTERMFTDPTDWPYVEYDVVFEDATTNYEFEFTTISSHPTPGFILSATRYGAQTMSLKMLKGTANPPPGKSIQYIQAKVKVSNRSGESVEDTYYLRFVYG